MPRGSTNYIPRPDASFSAWANHYLDAVEKWWSANGLDDSDLKALKDALALWAVAYPAHVKAQAAAEGAWRAKAAARAALEKEVRPVTNFIQSYFKTTNADRAEIGITVREDTARRAVPPTSRPLALIDAGTRLTHTLRLVDESTPTKRARLKGVNRAEVFVALTPTNTPAPANPNEYRYIGGVTDGTTTLSFEAAKGGMQAHYVARWVSTRGASGPWSETSSATVAA